MARPQQRKRDPLADLEERMRAQAGAPAEIEPEETATAAYAPAGGGRSLSDARVKELALDELWMEHQPRELVPEERLQALIAEGRAQPDALLAALEEAATADPYYGQVLGELRGLAASIRSQGVLQPIEVVGRQGRYIVRDGHRRSLAALLAGREAVPAIQVAAASDLEEVAHALIVNVQRQDLTAVEKGAALLRLALLVGRGLAAEEGGAAPAVMIDTFLEPAEEDGEAEATARPRRSTITGASRALAARVRERVCEMVGIRRDTYYNLLALNRLTPAARARGRGLTERQLRPIAKTPAELQAELVDLTARRGLSGQETATLARVARGGDRDAVSRLLGRLERERPVRRRIGASWMPLLAVVPEDYERRVTAMRAELAALAPEARGGQLTEIEEQLTRLRGLEALLGQVVAEYGQVETGAAVSPAPSPEA